MSWWSRYRRLRERGVLGINRRNTHCILDYNPRKHFPIVDGKLKMRDLCRSIDVPTPEIYGVLSAHSALRHLPRLLEPHDDFAIKPNRGAAGRGILIVVGRDGQVLFRHNGQRLGLEDVRQHVSGIVSGLYSLGGQDDEALIQKRVVPDQELAQISFQGTADVRVIVYKGVPVMAMLRLPTRMSGGRANLHQGAIGAGVELESGRTCQAVHRNRRITHHPDTGAGLLGFAVPYWPAILNIARRVGQAVGLGYVGVDIVIDRTDGPYLLEANARPGLAVQLANGCGLLERLRAVDRAKL